MLRTICCEKIEKATKLFKNSANILLFLENTFQMRICPTSQFFSSAPLLSYAAEQGQG
jgi:hypothetical protein